MATILVPEDQATIVAAIAAASDNDTISIADGTYTEYCYMGVNAATGVTFTSRGTDPSKVVVTSASQDHTFALQADCKVQNMTVNYTHGGSGAQYAITSLSFNKTFFVENVIINTNCSGIGAGSASGNRFERVKLTCTYKATTNQTWGIYGTGAGGNYIGSCLLVDFNWATIYYAYSTIVNTTCQTSYIKNTVLRGLYGNHQWNNVARSDSATSTYAGISNISSTGTIKNCLSWGWSGSNFGDYYYKSNPTTANNLDSSDVTSDGNPVFLDEAGDDFTLSQSGLAYQSGIPVDVPSVDDFTKDLLGNDYDDTTPSRGCYEFVSGTAQVGDGLVRASLGLSLGLGSGFKL